MTLQDIFTSLGSNPYTILSYFIGLPALSLLFGSMHGNLGNNSPYRHIYSLLVYAACIPGLFAVVLCIYTFFFEKQSFLYVNVLVYFVPVLSMVATLAIINKKVTMGDIPGFDKLSGLMLIISASFIMILLFQKTRIWVLFVGSFWMIALIFLVLFLLIKVGLNRLKS